MARKKKPIQRRKRPLPSRPGRKKPRATLSKSKKTAGSTPKRLSNSDARRIQVAIERLEKAQQVVAARSADLLALAGEIGQAAVVKERQHLVQSLADSRLLDYISAFGDWFAETSKDGLPEGLLNFELLPKAIMDWMADRLALTPYMKAKEELEVPAAKLSSFDCETDFQPGEEVLVKILVRQPGWKWGRNVLIRPRVELIAPPGKNTGTGKKLDSGPMC